MPGSKANQFPSVSKPLPNPFSNHSSILAESIHRSTYQPFTQSLSPLFPASRLNCKREVMHFNRKQTLFCVVYRMYWIMGEFFGEGIQWRKIDYSSDVDVLPLPYSFARERARGKKSLRGWDRRCSVEDALWVSVCLLLCALFVLEIKSCEYISAFFDFLPSRSGNGRRRCRVW